MINLYYTARTGRRNKNGHVITRGNVYKIDIAIDGHYCLIPLLADYKHTSGGMGLEDSLRGALSWFIRGREAKLIKID